jgi:hypothetical protein
MAVYGDDLGRFPGELIGEEIFGGVFGGIYALNNPVFSCYGIQPACENFGMIHHFFFFTFFFVGNKAALGICQDIFKNIRQ